MWEKSHHGHPDPFLTLRNSLQLPNPLIETSCEQTWLTLSSREMICAHLGTCPVSLKPYSMCQCGLCGCEGRCCLCLGIASLWTTSNAPGKGPAFSCAQHVPWECGKAAREALPGTRGWNCSSACISGFEGGI